MQKIEILAPAGSYESLLAGIANGADAVYLGGSAFGARAFAGNFTEEKLKEAIDYVHYHGKSLYLTVNTLLKNEELEEGLYEYILPFYEQGLDAAIVQDMGVLRFLHKHFPKLPLHASTQMTVTSTEAARFLKQCGVTRIVPARELSLTEIHNMKEACGLEIESFVHGALCYSYSGQCLMSSMIGGRSGNRGRCAQPCRLPYELKNTSGESMGKKDECYRLSPKDLCALDEIPQMIQAGIDSFKIEGRMKKPEYVAAVTRMYRKYVDRYLENPEKPYRVEEQDYKQLMELYNRGGFTQGYYEKHNGKDMMSMKRPNHQGLLVGEIQQIKGNQIFFVCKETIHPKDVLEVRQGEQGVAELTSPVACEKGKKICLNANNLRKLKIGQPVYRMKNKHMIEEMEKQWDKHQDKIGLVCQGVFQEGKKAILRLSGKGTTCEVVGNIVESAQKQPMTEEKIMSLLNKTGGTEYYFEKIELDISENIFLPVQAVKELRRQAIHLWEEERASQYRRNDAISREERKEIGESRRQEKVNRMMPEIAASFFEEEQLEELLKIPQVSLIYLELVSMSMEQAIAYAKRIHEVKKKCYLAFPQIFRTEAEKEWKKEIDSILSDSFDGYLIRNLEEYVRLSDAISKRKSTNDMERLQDKEWVLDYTIYQYNEQAEQFYKEHTKGKKLVSVFPLELNYQEIKRMNYQNGELIVYGRLPLMVSAQCQWKQSKGCIGVTKPVILRDRKQSDFFVLNQCKYCYNTIYSDKPLCLYSQKEEIEELSVARVRLQFVDETGKQVRDRVNEAISVFLDGKEVPFLEKEFTKGHWKRGIE